MERAWSIYRSGSAYAYSFSNSLRSAWEIEKSYAEFNRNSHTDEVAAYGDSHWADIIEASQDAKMRHTWSQPVDAGDFDYAGGNMDF